MSLLLRLPLLLTAAILMPRGASAAPAGDACSLLTADELQSIAGGKLQQAKASRQSDGVLSVSLCFFALEPFNRSVSLAVTRGDTSVATNRWARLFHSAARSEEEEERKEKGTPIRPVEGIGREAFWQASPVGGALYVLKKDVFFRLSVGGPDSEPVKIETARKLARRVLKRI